MTATQGRLGDKKPKALALPRGGFAAEADEELYEAGWYGGGEEAGGHYETTPVEAETCVLQERRCRCVHQTSELLLRERHAWSMHVADYSLVSGGEMATTLQKLRFPLRTRATRMATALSTRI